MHCFQIFIISNTSIKFPNMIKNNDFTAYILFAFSMFWRYLAVLSSTQTPSLNSSSNFKHHNFRHWLVLQMGHFIIPQNFLWTKIIMIMELNIWRFGFGHEPFNLVKFVIKILEIEN
jgi:hypothetical protein